MSKKRVIFISIFSLIFAISISAEQYKMTYKAVDIDKNEDIRFSYMNAFFSRGESLIPKADPDEELSAEPKYKSQMPIYANVIFNGDNYTLVLDKSSNTGENYDIIYFDANNNQDLTDDAVIPQLIPKVIRETINPSEMLFGPIEAMIKYKDGVRPYYFYLIFRLANAQAFDQKRDFRYVSLRVYSGGYYTCSIDMGKSKPQIIIDDYNSNGIFNELFSGIGDKFALSAIPDKQNGRYSFQTYSKYIEHGGKWYSLGISDDGRVIDINKVDLDLGIIRIPYEINSLELVSGNNVVMTVNGRNTLGPEGKITYECQIPVGTYRLYRYTMRSSNYGPRLGFNAAGTYSGEQFKVKKNEFLDPKIGLPLITNVTSRNLTRIAANPGDNIILKMTFTGQGGETFTRIWNDDNRGQIPKPTFKATDESGKVVAQGSFEYG